MARKDEFDFDIPDKKEKKEKPQREKKESKPLFGEGSSLGGLFKNSSSNDFEFSIGEDKKEKLREKKDGKPLFGEGSFLGGLFKKSSSDFGLSFDKEEKENSNNRSPKRLKWWHILLIVLGAVIIVVGIVVGIILGQINENIPGGIGGIVGGGEGGDYEEEIPEPDGVVSSVGSFLPNGAQEYILCEYTEYFSGETMVVLQKPGELRYDYNPYWIVVDNGKPLDYLSNKYSGNSTPEEFKEEIISIVLPQFGYTEETIALCELHIYNPVSFTRVTISEVTLTETDVTVKYSAGAVDGEMTEEYTLTGNYTKENNDFSFAYTTLPEDANLLRVAENLLGSAKYESYVMYNSWINELTFGDGYKLTLVTPTEE